MSASVSRKFLLGLYATVPISVLVVVIDQFFLGRRLRPMMQMNPDSWLLFATFFALPHIVASTIPFFDKKYVSHYSKKILPPIAIAIGALLIFPRVVDSSAFLALLYLWTVIHVIGQQYGLVRIMGGGFGLSLEICKWVAIGLGSLVYFGNFMPAHIVAQNISMRELTLWAGGATLIPFALLSWRVFRHADSVLARWYIAANMATGFAIFAFFSLGYPMLVFFVPRLIHDLSAFAFYVAHDFNRNRMVTHNWIYGRLRSFGIPLWFLGPWIAIIFAFPVTYYYQSGTYWAIRAVILVTMFHYYTEAFVWKKGSLHRELIHID